MGAGPSLAYQAPLVPQTEPICALDSRFCLPHPVSLTFKPGCGDFKVTETESGVLHFRCAGRTMSSKKVLSDNMGVPVLNLKQPFNCSFTDKFVVYAGNDSNQKICKFEAQSGCTKSKLSAQFTDALNGKPRHLVLKGDERAMIYIGEPKQGGMPVGKIYKHSNCCSADKYILTIAPGVDIAVLVIMCVALDEHIGNMAASASAGAAVA